MNIIFGKERAEPLMESFTVLELDTIRLGNDDIVAYCVVDNIPITDMPRLESMKSLHANLLIEYRKKNWNYCVQALEHLMNFWNHELDSFYQNLLGRIREYMENDPGQEWTGIVEKSIG
jgi:hypothetical protein